MSLQLLSNFLVDNLPPRAKHIISAKSSDSIPHVFKVLAENGILSVPVLNEGGRPIGLVDYVDIVCCVVQLINHTDLLGHDFYSILETEYLFKHTYASHITDLSERNPFIPVVQNASLLEAITIMTRHKLNRVPVISNEAKQGEEVGAHIINLVTQSAILNFISKNLDTLGPWVQKSLKDLGFKEKPVISIDFNKRALDAFQLMAQHRVNGIAVNDEKGHIIANISARDLKEILNKTRMFDDLYISVGEFISKVRQQDFKAVNPSICCTLEESLQHVITKMAAARIHRIYLVNAERKPIGVVSIHDILEKILEHIVPNEMAR